DLHCCVMLPTPCGCRHAAITACCGSRARSPISTAPTKSAGCIWLRLCLTVRSPTRCGARREIPAPLRRGAHHPHCCDRDDAPRGGGKHFACTAGIRAAVCEEFHVVRHADPASHAVRHAATSIRPRNQTTRWVLVDVGLVRGRTPRRRGLHHPLPCLRGGV